MKKIKIGTLSFLSILLIFSFINTSRAAPSYVGINKGDTYIWRAKPSIENLNATAIALLGKENWTIIYNEFNEMLEDETGISIDSLPSEGIGLKVEITNITEEIPVMPDINAVAIFMDAYISYKPNEWIIMMNSTEDPYPSGYILDPTNIAIDNYFYYFQTMPLFIPKGLDFNQIATWINTNITDMEPIYENITVTGLSNGFRVQVLGEFLEWALSVLIGGPFPIDNLNDLTINIEWNNNGVFKDASVVYSESELVSLELTSAETGNGEVPGYNIIIFLGISSVTIIGIIYIIRRKKGII